VCRKTPNIDGHPPDATHLPSKLEVALYVYGFDMTKNRIAEYEANLNFTRSLCLRPPQPQPQSSERCSPIPPSSHMILSFKKNEY